MPHLFGDHIVGFLTTQLLYIIFNISWIVEKLKIISNFDYKLTCFTSVNMHYQETACQFKKDLQDGVVFFCMELIELEPRHEKTGFLPMQKQRRRPALP